VGFVLVGLRRRQFADHHANGEAMNTLELLAEIATVLLIFALGFLLLAM